MVDVLGVEEGSRVDSLVQKLSAGVRPSGKDALVKAEPMAWPEIELASMAV